LRGAIHGLSHEINGTSSSGTNCIVWDGAWSAVFPTCAIGFFINPTGWDAIAKIFLPNDCVLTSCKKIQRHQAEGKK